MDTPYFINEQFGRVYQGQMALTDREATQEEVDAWLASRRALMVKDMVVSVFQGMAAMAKAQEAGITDYDLLTKVKGIIDATDDPVIKIAWDKATEWKRTSPLLGAIAQAIRLTEDQMDRLFLLADTIEA